jgi:hypothetical protein
MSPDDLVRTINKASDEIRERAAKQWRIPFVWPRDPEVIKALSRVAYQLDQLRTLLLTRAAFDTALSPQELQLAAQTVAEAAIYSVDEHRLREEGKRCWRCGKVSRDSAYERVERLEHTLIALAADDTLLAMLDAEVHRPTEYGNCWDDVFDTSDLARLREELAHRDNQTSRRSDSCDEARARLLFLVDKRASAWRHDRAADALRVAFMMLMLPVVLVTATIAIIFTVSYSSAEADLWSAISAAAVGGSISGFFRLRDNLARIRDMRVFLPLVVLQPTIGAMTGLVVFWIIHSGLVSIGSVDQSPAYFSAIGFIVGFSEPFFFRLVARVSGIEASPGRTYAADQERRRAAGT